MCTQSNDMTRMRKPLRKSPNGITAHTSSARRHVVCKNMFAAKRLVITNTKLDLMPLHSQLHTAHTHAMQALTQTTVDRATLEAARAEHLQLADRASKRITQLMADVGDVLTPPQRKALAEHLEQMHRMQRTHAMPHS